MQNIEFYKKIALLGLKEINHYCEPLNMEKLQEHAYIVGDTYWKLSIYIGHLQDMYDEHPTKSSDDLDKLCIVRWKQLHNIIINNWEVFDPQTITFRALEEVDVDMYDHLVDSL